VLPPPVVVLLPHAASNTATKIKIPTNTMLFEARLILFL